MVEYAYDAWGKPISVTGSLASTLGVNNPFRYRGYYYDEESGMYYLNARYFNPEWGRFVNADTYGGNLGGLLSHNVFAYCSNNPVMKSDPSGNYATMGASNWREEKEIRSNYKIYSFFKSLYGDAVRSFEDYTFTKTAIYPGVYHVEMWYEVLYDCGGHEGQSFSYWYGGYDSLYNYANQLNSGDGWLWLAATGVGAIGLFVAPVACFICAALIGLCALGDPGQSLLDILHDHPGEPVYLFVGGMINYDSCHAIVTCPDGSIKEYWY